MPTPLEHLRTDSHKEWVRRIYLDIFLGSTAAVSVAIFTNLHETVAANDAIAIFFASVFRGFYGWYREDRISKRHTFIAEDDLEAHLTSLPDVSPASLTALQTLVTESKKTSVPLAEIAKAIRELSSGEKNKHDFPENKRAAYVIAHRFLTNSNQELMVTFSDLILEWHSARWEEVIREVKIRIKKKKVSQFLPAGTELDKEDGDNQIENNSQLDQNQLNLHS